MKQRNIAIKCLLFVMVLLLMGIMGDTAGSKADIPLEQVSLPAGFKIELYASDVPDARLMVLSPSGTLFAGTRRAGNVYALRDHNNDFRTDEIVNLAKGMKFYTGSMFPARYHHQIFMPEHGSWNRSVPIGYRITLALFDKSRAPRYEIFAEGWLQGSTAWGRPVDLVAMADGSLLVSDDKAGVIYRISYSK
jgi:glucose/arabinose dehydrogenase